MTTMATERERVAPEAIFSPDRTKTYQQPHQTLQELVRDQAGRGAEAVAFRGVKGKPLSYGELLQLIERTVVSLRSHAVRRNDKVAVVLPNGPEMAAAFLAVGAGATCAPLNSAYRDKEFEFYLSDLQAKALIILAGMDSPARSVAARHDIPVLDLVPVPEGAAGTFELQRKAGEASNHVDFATPDDVALVLHTSGTTSRPKIVPLTHRNLCSSAHNIALMLDLEQKDQCLNVMPLFHIHGLIGAVLSSITAGASVFCTPGFNASKFFEWMDSARPTWYSAVPTMHQAVLARASAHRQIIARSPLRFIRSSSAALPLPVMAGLEEAFGVPVIESYGMTEASHQMTSNPLAPRPRKPGSVGIAAGPDVAIMDEGGKLLPVGEIGEVVIRGPNVTHGYENNPKANESAFTHGWFRTGDQGRFDGDGYLFLTGRLKELINRGGEKIAPKEVDEVLLQHESIAQAVAFALPHPTLGEDVGAAVVLKENTTATEEELRAFAARRLAEFKVPSRVVVVKEIPKGPTGKPQRIGLAEKLAAELEKNYIAPGSELEQQLVQIWTELLKVERVGTHDSFFAIGGDSLTASTLMIEVEKRFQKAVPVDQFLLSPTVETMARLIEGRTEAAAPGALGGDGARPKPIRDTFLGGIKNRLCQLLALYAPGYTTTRVWLHRMRGVSIGKNVSIGMSALIETAYPRLVSLGDNVTIGMRVIIIGHLRDLTAQARVGEKPTVQIEDDVYIGPGVIILPNVTIGKGAVVSAGSVVSRSVPPHTLVQGNPAKPIACCGVSLGGGVSYEDFLRHLEPIETADR